MGCAGRTPLPRGDGCADIVPDGDSYDRVMPKRYDREASGATVRVPRKLYEAELLRLQGELVKVQEWVRVPTPKPVS